MFTSYAFSPRKTIFHANPVHNVYSDFVCLNCAYSPVGVLKRVPKRIFLYMISSFVPVLHMMKSWENSHEHVISFRCALVAGRLCMCSCEWLLMQTWRTLWAPAHVPLSWTIPYAYNPTSQVCVYIYIHVHIYIYIYIYTCTQRYSCAYPYTQGYIRWYTWVCQYSVQIYTLAYPQCVKLLCMCGRASRRLAPSRMSICVLFSGENMWYLWHLDHATERVIERERERERERAGIWQRKLFVWKTLSWYADCLSL